MVKVNYISDLHIEFIKGEPKFEKRFPFKDGEILCLAGDIGYPQHDNYKRFLKYCSDKFKYVVLIAGNHEYYMKQSIEETNKMISDICSEYNNVIFLNNRTHYFEEYDIYIIGTTLWTNTMHLIENDVTDYNDFHRIQNMHINLMNELHEQSKEFLITELDKLKEMDSKIIVMTHHLPSYLMIHNKYKGHPLSPLFANQMEYIFDNYKIDWWICGHSHTNMQINIGKTQVVLNPVGYPGENYKINMNAHFEI